MGSVTIGAHPHDYEQLNGTDYDVELLKESDNKEYQDTNKPCNYLLKDLVDMSYRKHAGTNRLPIIKDPITMKQTQVYKIHWHPTTTKECNISNQVETSYTGMNKQESRKARGAIEKYIFISAYFIAKATVIYCDIQTVCSYLGASAGPPAPGPASEQYIVVISPVIKDTVLSEVFTLTTEEEFDSLFVYCYFVIMFSITTFERKVDLIKFYHYVYINGYYITPIMREVLDQIYEKYRLNSIESFEMFIKRVTLIIGKKYKDCFNKDEIQKIASYSNFDISLINKCLLILTEYYIVDQLYNKYRLNSTESIENFIKRVTLKDILDEIYQDQRTSVLETFEEFIKRVCINRGKVYQDYFNKDEMAKISLYIHNDKSLIAKCIHICTDCYISVNPEISEIKDICKKLKDVRNESFHNTPEPDQNVFNNYSEIFKEIELSIKDLATKCRKLFPYSDIDKFTSLMSFHFMFSKCPLSLIQTCLILLIFICLVLYILYNILF